MCLHHFNPTEPSCQETDGNTPYSLFARPCGSCPCVPPIWKLSIPAYVGRNTGLIVPAATRYLTRFPQYDGNAFSGNEHCAWQSAPVVDDSDPLKDFRWLLGHGFRYSQTVLGGSTQLDWGILFYDAQAFLPFVGLSSWIPWERFKCLGRNEFRVFDDYFADMPQRLTIEPYWP